MKRTKLDSLSETQLEIMSEVWAGGEVTVTQVWDSLTQRRSVARNTVHTMMDRLANRGWLKRRTVDQGHFYSARSSRSSTLQNLVGRLIDTAFAGSAEELVLTLLQGRKLSADETKRIRKLIDQAKENEP